MTREETISKKAVMQVLAKLGYGDEENGAEPEYMSALADVVKEVKAIKSLEQEPKIGHWIKEESIWGWDGKSYQCSACGRSIHLDTDIEDLEDYPYCHCGAKMG